MGEEKRNILAQTPSIWDTDEKTVGLSVHPE
jgi:hypothetical protein